MQHELIVGDRVYPFEVSLRNLITDQRLIFAIQGALDREIHNSEMRRIIRLYVPTIDRDVLFDLNRAELAKACSLVFGAIRDLAEREIDAWRN